MKHFKDLLKESRLKQKLLIREVAHALHIDAALVSHFEKGTRKPTRRQVAQLSQVLNLKEDELMAQWLGERIIYELRDESVAMAALRVAEQHIKYENKKDVASNSDAPYQKMLQDIDAIKKQLNAYRKHDSYRIAQAIELEYTFESNRIEGNTLTLRETDLVINEGMTISGKSMREHLEAINHRDAVELMKGFVSDKQILTERTLLQIHHLVLRGIDQSNAGKYRSVQVMIKGSKHVPPQAYLIGKQMEDYFLWYKKNRKKIHPLVLAAEMHERLVTIHPFIDGNGRTARLVMNLILLQHGYVIANVKGDAKSRLSYYEALEEAQVGESKNDFISLIASVEFECMRKYMQIIGGL
jgi:Fic family protein